VLVRCAQLRAALATSLKGGIGNGKALARDKASLGALRAGWVRMLRAVGIIPAIPYKSDSSLRPCLGRGASLGEEAVSADSGWAGEVAAGVGRVRNLAFLSILRTALLLY